MAVCGARDNLGGEFLKGIFNGFHIAELGAAVPDALYTKDVVVRLGLSHFVSNLIEQADDTVAVGESNNAFQWPHVLLDGQLMRVTLLRFLEYLSHNA